VDVQSTGKVRLGGTQKCSSYNSKSSGQVGECMTGQEVSMKIIHRILYDNTKKERLAHKEYLGFPLLIDKVSISRLERHVRHRRADSDIPTTLV
jgi:hypothetical protein